MSTFKVLGHYVSLTFNLENFLESENCRSGRDLSEQLRLVTRELGPGRLGSSPVVTQLDGHFEAAHDCEQGNVSHSSSSQ